MRRQLSASKAHGASHRRYEYNALCLRSEKAGGINTFKEVGYYFTENIDEYQIDIEMQEFFDYEGFGEYMSQEYCGKFIRNDYLYYSGSRCLNDILEKLQDENESLQMGGM